eukprot:Awhi_evm1s1211
MKLQEQAMDDQKDSIPWVNKFQARHHKVFHLFSIKYQEQKKKITILETKQTENLKLISTMANENKQLNKKIQENANEIERLQLSNGNLKLAGENNDKNQKKSISQLTLKNEYLEKGEQELKLENESLLRTVAKSKECVNELQNENATLLQENLQQQNEISQLEIDYENLKLAGDNNDQNQKKLIYQLMLKNENLKKVEEINHKYQQEQIDELKMERKKLVTLQNYDNYDHELKMKNASLLDEVGRLKKLWTGTLEKSKTSAKDILKVWNMWSDDIAERQKSEESFKKYHEELIKSNKTDMKEC